MVFVPRTDDPFYDADRYLDALEHEYDHRPICCECKQHIQEDYAYEIDGKYICIECMEDNHKDNMDKYDG